MDSGKWRRIAYGLILNTSHTCCAPSDAIKAGEIPLNCLRYVMELAIGEKQNSKKEMTTNVSRNGLLYPFLIFQEIFLNCRYITKLLVP